ncbi:MAG: TIGR02530 family flagellar biosynthesis protein [Pseudobdellovibrionaceae bacterium]
MDIKKVSNFESMVQPDKGGAVGKTQVPGGPSFQETLNGLQNGLHQPQVGKNPAVGGLQAPKAGPPAEAVKFSNHAVERMQTRGISFNKADMERLNEAVSRAASKGSKDTLVLMNDSALIVSVKNKTVVTVMDKAALKENVFTNIDSTIVM